MVRNQGHSLWKPVHLSLNFYPGTCPWVVMGKSIASLWCSFYICNRWGMMLSYFFFWRSGRANYITFPTSWYKGLHGKIWSQVHRVNYVDLQAFPMPLLPSTYRWLLTVPQQLEILLPSLWFSCQSLWSPHALSFVQASQWLLKWVYYTKTYVPHKVFTAFLPNRRAESQSQTCSGHGWIQIMEYI